MYTSDEPGARAHPEKILLVDDNLTNLQVLSKMLEHSGHELLVALHGESAIKIAQKVRPALILLDIMMPGIDGFEVCRRLKAEATTRETTVIFLSALNEIRDKVHGFDLGAVDYITKPFQVEEVLARVNTHLTIRRLQQRLAEQNTQLAALNARMKHDLEAAAGVQRSLLPQALPQVAGVRFAWVYRPCDELGGDSLNVYPLGLRHVGLYVLDVCGHGVSAALLSVALTHALAPRRDSASIVIRAAAGVHEDLAMTPTDVILHLNHRFPMSLEAGLFATILYVVIDLADGVLRFVSAGHPGLVLSRQGAPPLLYEPAGLPIGIAEEAAYEEQTIPLQPGDRLFLYSDGLLEEPDSGGELFGKARLLERIALHRSLPLNDSVQLLEQAVLTWSGKACLQDDLAILAVDIQSLSQTERP